MSTQTLDAIPAEAKRVAVAVIAGLIAPILDTTIVTIGFDRLAAAMSASVDTIGWTNTGYLLALAVAVPLAGWSALRFGSRTVWRTGLAVFLLGSVLCASAWNIHALIVFRVLQGLGAGLLFPLMTSVLVAASGGRALGRLVAMVSVPTALGPILGPVVGGVILNWLDWRWLFLVNVPVCLIALALSGRIPDDRSQSRTPLDWVGLMLLAPGLVGVLLGLSNVHAGFVRADVLIPATIGLVLLAGFVVRGLHPRRPMLVDVRVLGRRAVASSSVALFFFGVASFGAMLALPLYLQQIRGESVLAAAFVLVPQGVGALASRTIGGHLTDAIGARRVAVAGFAVVAVATIPFALVDVDTPLWWLMAALFIRGLGLGVLLSPIMSASFVGLPSDMKHDASMVTRTFQQVGGSVGTAIVAVVLTAGTADAAGFRDAFWWTVVLTAAGALLALRMPGTSAPVPALQKID
ncbi:drug resistance transporter, EmrB/QacA subfamily [Gordonia malaquae]|uniref:Putative drug resistance transporter n=1 Tax=Gordonia malaquae NBRC 108250 TaxID=1223542 RepID=M3ULF2_GORML|nr:DHA2 family efflux MFS transporter permease subunit [Gordonia malaquae]GAC80545.1 putative drug resistance transporter [Gordonia malaquae NBRC 108250]SEC08932.1 drug resistance transporter, EmrB/QacA subfamily [Gordonia malaquae]